jgi:hypothetical protein
MLDFINVVVLEEVPYFYLANFFVPNRSPLIIATPSMKLLHNYNVIINIYIYVLLHKIMKNLTGKNVTIKNARRTPIRNIVEALLSFHLMRLPNFSNKSKT